MKKTTDQRITELEEKINDLSKIFSEHSLHDAQRKVRSIELNTKLQRRVQELEEQMVKRSLQENQCPLIKENQSFWLFVIAVIGILNLCLILTYINK